MDETELSCVVCREPVDYSGEWPDVGDYGYPRPADDKPIHETCDLEEQIKALKADIEQLRKDAESSFCAYCEEGIFVGDGKGLERLHDHIENVCPLHPVKALKGEIVGLRRLVELAAEHLECECDKDHEPDYDCPWCQCLAALHAVSAPSAESAEDSDG